MSISTPPSNSLHALARIKGWQLLTIGNSHTPPDWSLKGAIFLSLEQQALLGFRTVDFLPYDSHVHKSIGYLFAIQHGADQGRADRGQQGQGPWMTARARRRRGGREGHRCGEGEKASPTFPPRPDHRHPPSSSSLDEDLLMGQKIIAEDGDPNGREEREERCWNRYFTLNTTIGTTVGDDHLSWG